MTWPKVTEACERPANKGGACFYCKQLIGEEHARDCVRVTRRVRVSYRVELEIDVPHHWTDHDIDRHRNESSWCASNAIRDLEEFQARIDGGETGWGCLCEAFHCDVLRSVDDTPRLS